MKLHVSPLYDNCNLSNDLLCYPLIEEFEARNALVSFYPLPYSSLFRFFLYRESVSPNVITLLFVYIFFNRKEKKRFTFDIQRGGAFERGTWINSTEVCMILIINRNMNIINVDKKKHNVAQVS